MKCAAPSCVLLRRMRVMLHLEIILEISQRFRAACNIFLVATPAEFRYVLVFLRKHFSHARRKGVFERLFIFKEPEIILSFSNLQLNNPSPCSKFFTLLTLLPSLFPWLQLSQSQWLLGAVNVPPVATFLWLAANLLLHRPTKPQKPTCSFSQDAHKVDRFHYNDPDRELCSYPLSLVSLLCRWFQPPETAQNNETWQELLA